MNTDKLAKHYPALLAFERLTMLHASEKRGDTTEQNKILDASPEITQSDAGRIELSLMHLSTLHYALLFATACEFWHAKYQLAREHPKNEIRLNKAGLFWAANSLLIQSRYIAERDGWNLFMKRSGLDESRITNAVLSEHHMFALLDEDPNSKPDPHRDEEAMDALHDHFHPNTERVKSRKITTAEEVANDWRIQLEALSASIKDRQAAG